MRTPSLITLGMRIRKKKYLERAIVVNGTRQGKDDLSQDGARQGEVKWRYKTRDKGSRWVKDHIQVTR